MSKLMYRVYYKSPQDDQPTKWHLVAAFVSRIDANCYVDDNHVPSKNKYKIMQGSKNLKVYDV